MSKNNLVDGECQFFKFFTPMLHYKFYFLPYATTNIDRAKTSISLSSATNDRMHQPVYDSYADQQQGIY